jgi:multicomponent Na+:H+ antiporter subunit C
MIIYALTGAALFCLGIVGIVLRQNPVQKLICFNLFTSGIFMIFIATSYTQKPDSVATALVLTGLVVSLGATALGLMLIRANIGAK